MAAAATGEAPVDGKKPLGLDNLWRCWYGDQQHVKEEEEGEKEEWHSD